MNIKKILGVALGLVVGFIPYVNAVASSAVAFAGKKTRLGLLIVFSLAMQIVMMVIVAGDDTKLHNEYSLFGEDIQRNILQIQTPGPEPLTNLQFEDSLLSSIKRAAQKRASETNFPIKVYTNLLENKFSDRQRQNFKETHYKIFRSEEHTSELQSRRDLVCRLLLEKKKKKK